MFIFGKASSVGKPQPGSKSLESQILLNDRAFSLLPFLGHRFRLSSVGFLWLTIFSVRILFSVRIFSLVRPSCVPFFRASLNFGAFPNLFDPSAPRRTCMARGETLSNQWLLTIGNAADRLRLHAFKESYILISGVEQRVSHILEHGFLIQNSMFYIGIGPVLCRKFVAIGAAE